MLEQFKDDIESHNQSYELDNYSNRKRGKPSIEETINLTELTPDGLDWKRFPRHILKENP